MTRSFRAWLLTACALAPVAACDCSRRSSINHPMAEVGVVWTDADAVQHADRDATYDFGDAFMGDRVGKKLVIKNLGAGPLTLVSLEPVDGDPVTVADAVADQAAFDVRFVAGQTVEAADEAALDMFFTPPQSASATTPSEPHWAKLTLTGGNTREGEETAVILLKGNGVQGSCLLPDVMDFGKVPTGEKFTLGYDVRNTAPVEAAGFVGDPFSSTGDHLAFGHVDGSPFGAFSTPPSGTTHLAFTFAPTELRGYEAEVKLRASAQCPEAEVTLKGEGVDQVLSWAPTSLDYGYVAPTVTATRDVTFTNLGKIPVTLRNVAVAAPSDYGVRAAPGQDPTELTIPGDSQPVTMTVACRPSTLGPHDSQLTFDTGLARQPHGTVSLKCFGGGPHITVLPRPTLAFGKVAYFAGTNPPYAVSRKVRVMNSGTRPPVPDPTLNLRLGQVGASGPGELPYVSLLPTGSTADGEFSASLGAYNPSVGLEAVAGNNFVDITVTLTPQTVGPKSAKLTIYSNDSNEPAVDIDISADAQVMPPCTYSLSPASLNFGLITPPTFKDLPVKVTNLAQNPTDLCYLSGLEIAPGGDPAFTMPNGPIASKELQPGESYDIVVRVWPQGAVPSGVVTLQAYLHFSVSSPTAPEAVVPLVASIGPACLTVAPDSLDFGTVKKDCSSTTRTFTVYNICTQNVVLQSFTMQAAAGQQAGGPNCPGAAPCPEFLLTQTPSIGAGGLTLAPGSNPVSFQAKYHPIDFGPDSGAVAINVVQSGQNVTYLVSLQGNGDGTGLQTDVFTQDIKPQADILLTVDSSGSMSDKQASLGSNFASFILYANAANVDYQIGVTTADDDDAVCIMGICTDAGDKGRLRGTATNPKVLTPLTPQVDQKFRDKVNVGINGSGTEEGFITSLKALTPPLITGENAGFLRYDANLAIVVVSDAGDQSPDPFSYYFNRFMNIKGFNRANMFTFNIVGPFEMDAPSGCTYDDTHDASSYLQMATQTNGVKEEICTPDWAAALQNLGKTAFGFRTTFFLTSVPDLNGGKTLDVKVNGVASPSTDWAYDAAANAVAFDAAKTPSPGDSLSITYFVACL